MFEEKMNELNEFNEIYLVIKARPNAPQTVVRDKMSDGVFKIDISAVPEKNKANQTLIKYLATEFKVSSKQIKIISGAGDRKKMLRIKN